MRRFLHILITMLFLTSVSNAQIIQGYDTVCINSPLELTTTVSGASSYYWGFCSAYLNNIPQGSSIAAGTGLDQPTSIAMAKDGNNFYVFCFNQGGNNEMIRYDFGTALSNAPIASNLGDFGGIVGQNPKGLWFVQDKGNWYAFLAAGNGPGNSQIVRFDFGASLANIPVPTDLGSLGGQIINPQDLYIFNEAGNWYGITMEGFTGNVKRLEFGSNLNSIPTVFNLGNIGFTLSFPTGFWPITDGTDWFIFAVNAGTNSVTRIDFGASLVNNAPAATNLGNFNLVFNSPRDISIIRDCDDWYGYVTDEPGNKIVKLNFQGSLTNVPVETDLGNFAGLNGPTYITNFLRSRDNVFAFTTNRNGNSISRLEYNSCLVPNVLTSTLETPPVIAYPTAGLYNVFLVTDEGLPTMQVGCKLIRVIPVPPINLQVDTMICLGDTINITGNGVGLTGIHWEPSYNFYPPSGDTETLVIYPRETITYNVEFEFASGGCLYDSAVVVTVSQVVADAGKDRFVADGAATILGGPRTSHGIEYSYKWIPSTYLNAATIPEPRCQPYDQQFYVLEVSNDSSGCKAYDSVYVFNQCTDIVLPNAFNPISDVNYNRYFGIANVRLSKLNYFRIFNRWGNLIFETTNPAIQWDGNQNNIPCPVGSYVWIVDGECDNGYRVQKQGTVLLAR